MNELTIANTAIRQDSAGRFCLNDLHHASGGETRRRPSTWLQNQQTRALVDALVDEGASRNSVTPVATSNDGINNGTFVVKELVYAFAMWISPAFHLKVIRAYDALVAKPAGLNAANLTRLQILEQAVESERGRLVLEHQVEEMGPKAAALDLISASEDAVTLREAAKLLGIPLNKLTDWLHVNGWTYRLNGRWVAYQQHIQNGRLQFKEATFTSASTGEQRHAPYCHILPKGLALLAKHFAAQVPA